jgi:para-aminobenzoate synthetase/4-amino-4-deoxychorismate lyase
VHVPELFAVERYRTVLQMTSTIAAELRSDCGLLDIFRALFPCGSVTGAPKIQTMRIIDALETSPREVYCGAIGVVEPGGDCTFSVPIRTLWVDCERAIAEYGVGSGITADAVIDDEAAELAAKALVLQMQWPEFALIETLRLEDGALVRLERHLARMAASCSYFGRPFPADALRHDLQGLAALHPAGRLRVRIVLHEDARYAIESEPLAAAVSAVTPSVTLGREPVDASDVFLFHKTTQRGVHERACAAQPDAFDVLLWNRHGRITEFTRGNVVVQIDGELRTPPRTDGLLAGCLRAELLAAGTIVEREIHCHDLARAERIWFVNSLRGWLEVRRTGIETQPLPSE